MFPEGISDSTGRLEPLRTGAARMALASLARGTRVTLMPIGLHFHRLVSFRSRATVAYGVPFDCVDLAAAYREGRWCADAGMAFAFKPEPVSWACGTRRGLSSVIREIVDIAMHRLTAVASVILACPVRQSLTMGIVRASDDSCNNARLLMVTRRHSLNRQPVRKSPGRS